MLEDLGLDEAIVTVNRSIIQDPIDVYYQIDECFGCPLEKLKTLLGSSKSESFIIQSKFKLQLELRNAINGSSLCRLQDLSLNNHGHYMIDLGRNTKSWSEYECSLATIANGDCYLCPIAMLLCLLIAITACEQLYSKFWVTKVGKSSPQSPSPSPSHQVNSNESSQIDHRQLSSSSTNTTIEQSQEQQAISDEPSQQQQTLDLTHEQTPESRNNKCTSSSKTTHRFESLDAFRGLTIAGMIMVNYGGAGYTFLEHKPWNGITLADLVFPFFIFSMGASIAISLNSTFRRGEKTIWQILAKTLRRSIILMVLGLCLNSKWLNGRNLNELRLTGVLQRFSISYLIVSVMYCIELTLNNWLKSLNLYRAELCSKIANFLVESMTALNFLAIYLYFTFFFDYSNHCPAGYIGPGGQTELGTYANCTGGAAAWLDRLILGQNHLYHDHELKTIFKTQVSHDPEGILGSSTSILLTLIGLQCGKALAKYKNHRTRLITFLIWLVVLNISCATIVFIPINKRLWSLTFVSVSGVAAFALISTLYLFLDVYNCKRTFLIRLLISAGKNSIFLYVGHSLLSNMLPWHFAIDETSHFYLLLRLTWATFVWLLIAHYLASKKLFIKI